MGLDGISIPPVIATSTGKERKNHYKLAGNVETCCTGLLGTLSQSYMEQKPHKQKMPYSITYSEQPFLLGVLQLTLC